MNFPRAVLLTACLRAPAIFAATSTPTIATSDGLMLGFGEDGRVATVRVDGKDVPLAARPALVRVRDAAARSALEPVMLAARREGDRVVLHSTERPLGLEIAATISSRGGFIEIAGEIAGGPRDRCIDLALYLPIDRRGFSIGTGLQNERARRRNARKEPASEADIDTSEDHDNAMYPLCPATNPATGVGLCLAVPPTHPTRFFVASDDGGVALIFRIGLSAASAQPGRTAFRAIAYRHDPAWGFRSALARYYEFYREDFFTRHAQRLGAWTTQNASRLAHPELYAYHEAGFTAWRHPGGTDSGINLKPSLQLFDEGPIADTLEDYERLCEFALDERHGIYSLPYTIVGQRQLLQLPALPRERAEAMRVLDGWSPKTSIRFDGPPQAGSFRSAEEHKTIIRNSTLHGADHQLAFMPRGYRGPTLTFPQNPNPHLFQAEGQPTVASYTLDYYIPMMLQSTTVDGIYVDSLGRWCGLYNYRTEHFKDSTVPLTYGGEPAQVCLWNLQSHAEYLWEAARRLHARGKILMANGVGADRVMLGFACDVMGREGAPAYDSGEGFYAARVAAGVKPYCLLNATHRTSARLWNSCLYLGYLMGCNSPAGLADEAKYLPLIIRCNEAGWQPVTQARARPAEVGVERWGGEKAGAPLLFTVMNRSTGSVNAEVVIDGNVMQRRRPVRAATLVAKRPFEMTEAGGRLVLKFRLGPEEAEVLEIAK